MKSRNPRSHRRLMIAVVVALIAAGTPLTAVADDASRIASQYAAWAGGKANADALVKGLRDGKTVMLSTVGPDRVVNLAGFTPTARLTEEEVAAALAEARAALRGLGIQRPSADQIQAALIGGEVRLANGSTRLVRGSAATPAPGIDVVASR